MSEMIDTDSELFAGGPPVRLERSLGLIKPDEPRIIHRAVLAGLVGWAPLVVLAATQDFALWGDRVRSLLLDFAVPARSLIAAPLLVLAELVCIPQLGSIVRHFLDAGLVPESERPRFDAAIASTRRLCDSRAAEVLTEVPDFSATTDLYQVVANVYDMGTIPLDLTDVVPLVGATLLPFVPVALMAVPLDVILAGLANLLL